MNLTARGAIATTAASASCRACMTLALKELRSRDKIKKTVS